MSLIGEERRTLRRRTTTISKKERQTQAHDFCEEVLEAEEEVKSEPNAHAASSLTILFEMVFESTSPSHHPSRFIVFAAFKIAVLTLRK